ncbi:hypothetical protein Goari_019818 [Gossypium aridum]|uniref:Uncharacterized protein n=1 Tax=Gossypium aridum TaxID=34290 RepID=A0A7J8WTW8_GOSAI|nr:hypothetical protein [Gossypium aridum]
MEIDFQNPSLLDKENEELLIIDERNVEEEINYELCLVGTFLGERMVQVRQLPSSFDAEALAKILGSKNKKTTRVLVDSNNYGKHYNKGVSSSVNVENFIVNVISRSLAQLAF